MKNDKKSAKNKRECHCALNLELCKCADDMKSLEEKQLSGDYTAETARKINVLGYHIEVLKNRLNGKFNEDARHELELSIP